LFKAGQIQRAAFAQNSAKFVLNIQRSGAIYIGENSFQRIVDGSREVGEPLAWSTLEAA
jgi:hypothetical protein